MSSNRIPSRAELSFPPISSQADLDLLKTHRFSSTVAALAIIRTSLRTVVASYRK
jgi:hypothetical protein